MTTNNAYCVYYEEGQYIGKGTGTMDPVSNPTVLSIAITKEIYDTFNPDMWMLIGNELIKNPDYEEQERQKQRQKQIDILKEQIDDIDKKRVRAICEPSIKDETTGQTWLEYYNEQVQNLREQISNL